MYFQPPKVWSSPNQISIRAISPITVKVNIIRYFTTGSAFPPFPFAAAHRAAAVN